jgi:hypothetical protein
MILSLSLYWSCVCLLQMFANQRFHWALWQKLGRTHAYCICWKSFDYLLKLPSPNMMFWKISHPWVAVHFVVEHPVSLCVYLCLNSRHHISPKPEIQTKLINNELGAEQALWNKSNVLIPCIYKEKIWVDVSTKQVMAPLFFCLGNEIEFYFYEFDIIFLYALCIVNCSISLERTNKLKNQSQVH